jgi:RND superfamily putative drug exporter
MLLSRLATACYRHRWIVLAGWAVVLIAGLAATPTLFGRLTSEVGTVDGSESQRAAQDLSRAHRTGEEIFAVADGRRADDPGLRASVDRVAGEIGALAGVAAVATPWNDAGRTGAADPRAVSRDGNAVALAVRFDPGRQGSRAVEPAFRLLRTIDAPRVVVGGGPLQDDEMDAQAGEDLAHAELYSMPVVLVLLRVLFGGLVAAGLPVLIALVGVPATLGSLLAISLVTDVSVYAVNVVTMLGLGLAVDYALLIISRFREERAADPEIVGALQRAYATAGRTIAFSGLTVAASLAGLLVFPDDFLRSMGFAGFAVVLLDLAAALTLLPALLSVAGRRIRPARVSAADRGLFVAVSRLVRRRPVLVIAATGTVLLLAAAPFLGARYANPDARSLPASSQSRQLAEIADQRFGRSADVDPITIVGHGAVPPERMAPYLARLRALDGVRDVSVRTGVPGLTVVDVVPEGESQGPTAMRLVGDVRGLPAPVPAEVAGDAAELTDYEQALRSRLPWALGIVVAATFVLLFLFTGSVVVPAKAVVMNTLSLGASFGALVWVFQDGHLGAVVGTQALSSLSISTPVLVFAIAFGLSMDYEVFLLSRIAETYRQTGDNGLAVERGLQRTGRIVTAAALLMAVIFAGFVAGGFSPVKQVGLGLLIAIVVDATVVRMLLVPAFMTLMGRANWWAPRPLRRLHRRIGLTEQAAAPPSRPEAAVGTL